MGTFAARTPILVEPGDGKRIRNIDLIDKFPYFGDDILHLRKVLGIDCRIRVEINRGWNAADHEIRVRVLAAEDSMQFDNVSLPRQGLEIMRHRHEIGFRW